MNRVIVFFFLLSIVSCSVKDTDNQRINEAATKLQLFGTHSESIYLFNEELLGDFDNLQKGKYVFFKSAIDSLALIRDELISAAGGYTELGQYFNPPAINYVDDYFYGETYFRNNSHQFFFATLNKFFDDLKKLDANSGFEKDLNNRTDILIKHYELKSRELIFKNLAVNEAVELIDKLRAEITLEQTKCILRQKKVVNNTYE